MALNKTLRAECESALPALEAAKTPASEEMVVEIVMRRMVAYGITANLAYSHGVTWESFVSGLEGLPAYAIEDAFDRWDRGEGTKGNLVAAGFPPRPPQLAILAQSAKETIWQAAYRAKRALKHVETEGLEWTPERKAAERQKMIAAGYLNPDGSVNMIPKTKAWPGDVRPAESPQQVADKLRATDARSRHAGVPISRHHVAQPADEIGDVI